MSHAVFETCNGIDFRPRLLLTLMQNAIHALYTFLFASDMATDSILLERVSVAFKTQNETVLKEIFDNLSFEISEPVTLSEKDYLSRLGKLLRRNVSVESYIPDRARKNPLVALRYIYIINIFFSALNLYARCFLKVS